MRSPLSLLLACLAVTASQAATPKIEHIVVLILENRCLMRGALALHRVCCVRRVLFRTVVLLTSQLPSTNSPYCSRIYLYLSMLRDFMVGEGVGVWGRVLLTR